MLHWHLSRYLTIKILYVISYTAPTLLHSTTFLMKGDMDIIAFQNAITDSISCIDLECYECFVAFTAIGGHFKQNGINTPGSFAVLLYYYYIELAPSCIVYSDKQCCRLFGSTFYIQ